MEIIMGIKRQNVALTFAAAMVLPMAPMTSQIVPQSPQEMGRTLATGTLPDREAVAARALRIAPDHRADELCQAIRSELVRMNREKHLGHSVLARGNAWQPG